MCLSSDLYTNYPSLSRDHEELYVLIEDPTIKYSGFGWAAGDDRIYWDPDLRYYWPKKIQRDHSLTALITLFKERGYQELDILRHEYDDYRAGYERVAIYVTSNKTPTHVSRQLIGGLWTSKLAENQKIEHNTIKFLEPEYFGSNCFGNVVEVMERKQVCQHSERPDVWRSRGYKL
jgi:hypothetical protein